MRTYSDTERGQIHLRIFPPRVAEARSALVCLHPFPYSGSFFETIAPLLGAGRLICAPDCPGYGGSDPPSGMLSMEEMAAAIHEALAACRSRLSVPFDLFGFHSGCLLAVEMARLEPGRIRRMALVDVPYFTPKEQSGRYLKSTAETRYSEDISSLEDIWEFSVRRRIGDMPFERALSNFAEILRAGERANWGYHATLTYECAARFREVRHRTLVVATEYMLKEHTRKAAADIPGAAFVERKDVTRAVMEQGAPAIAEEVLAFLG
ncbi:MAG: alpha/beta hydrolase [Gammaproteobacteria bacterium]|nr:alpha/beta hydrolase [Gammaproteobacteria bacterium]MCY4256560.1 alpha/beta hydrolase [Gammaproteobacteria bacterium]